MKTLIKRILQRIANEPAVAVAIADAVIAVGLVLGVDIDAEQLAGAITFLTVVSGLVVRAFVTPTAKLEEPAE